MCLEIVDQGCAMMLRPQRPACLFILARLWSVSGMWCLTSTRVQLVSFQLELQSNIIALSFGLRISSFLSVLNSFIQVFGESKRTLFYVLITFYILNFWLLRWEAVIPAFFYPVIHQRITGGHIGAVFARFYDPNTLLLLRLFLSYHSVWGHPSFRLSHDQQDLAFQNQIQINLWVKRLIGKTQSSVNILLKYYN